MRLAFFILCALACTHAIAETYKREYKYYLDASRAEEVLAGIVIGPRLVDEEWLNIIGERREQEYKVRPGDTLWGIAGREFNNPFLWRKLWQVNSFLTNPHELEVGQLLKYYMEGDRLADGAGGGGGGGEGVRIPLVKLLPRTAAKGFDLDQDAVYTRDLKNRYRPSLLVVGEKEILGEITGSYTEREGLSEHDDIYMTFVRGDTVKIGDEFTIVRYERALVDSTKGNRPVIGTLMRRVGELRITGFGEHLVKGELTSQGALVHRGDGIILTPKTVAWSQFFNPPPELEARIVMGEDDERKYFGQGEVVLLNKGTADGVREGFLFRIYQDFDLRTKRRIDVEPTFKGEVQVVYAGELASVGYVLRTKEPVIIGDALVPAQAFLNPPPPPQRSAQTIELK